MTLSEHERRTLAEIETGCRADDPGFAARLDLIAVRARRSRVRLIAECAIWLGSLLFVTGAGMARGPVSIGAVIACYGVVMIVAGIVARVRNRAPRNRTPAQLNGAGPRIWRGLHARAADTTATRLESIINCSP